MPKPTEHKTVQSPILTYAQDLGWTFIPREEVERRRGFDPSAGSKTGFLSFNDLLDAKIREFNPGCTESEGALIDTYRPLHPYIYGNHDFVEREHRERDLIFITRD